MKSKLKLNPNPTFEIIVAIPVAGQLQDEDVAFTVKSLPQSKLDELTSEGILYSDFAKEVVAGWDIDAEFSKDNLMVLLDNYPQSGKLIFDGYAKEIYKAADKN